MPFAFSDQRLPNCTVHQKAKNVVLQSSAHDHVHLQTLSNHTQYFLIILLLYTYPQ